MSLPEGEISTLSGKINDPEVEDTFTLAINWGDTQSSEIALGTMEIESGGVIWNPDTREFSVDHQYVDNTSEGTVSVTDAANGSSTATFAVEVENVDPTAQITSPVGISDWYILTTDYDGGSFYTPIVNGSFGTTTPIDDQNYGCYGAGIGDFDNDNFLEILVGDGSWEAGNYSGNTWYYDKTGPGNSFAEAVSIDSTSYTYRMDFAEADFNGDGNLDAVMSSFNADNLNNYFTIYIGNGEGKFTLSTILAGSSNSLGYTMGMDAADFNGDDRMDFVASSSAAGKGAYVYLGNGDGTFQAPMPLDVESSSYSYGVSAGDFNNDSSTDLVFGVNATFYPGNGDGTFGSGVSLGFDMYPMAEADLNTDGNLDILYTDMSSLIYRLGNGDGTFGTPTTVFTNDSLFGLASMQTPPLSSEIQFNEGDEVQFTGTSQDPGLLDTHTIEWDFGDGTFVSGILNPTHVYVDDGTYTATLTVTDDDGGVGRDSLTIEVLNVAPSFEAGPDETLLPSSKGAFSRSISFTDPGADLWNGKVNWGDNATDEDLVINQEAKTFNLNHTYMIDGTYPITVTVNDGDGGSHTDTFQVEVQLNTPPVAQDDLVTTNEDTNLVIDVIGDNGKGPDIDAENNIDRALTVNLTIPSLGTLVNNHDGTFTYYPNGNFEYLAVGETATETFEYQIVDTFGETDRAEVTITIYGVNDAPVVLVNSPSMTVDEGDTAQNTGTFADMDLSDCIALTASVGEITWDTGNSGDWTWSYVTTDGPDQSQTVTITATDSDGAASSTTFALGVNNVAPVITNLTNSAPDVGDAQEGQRITLSGAFTDVGMLDTHAATIEWGDGTIEQGAVTQGSGFGTFSGNHAYANGGIYDVKVSLLDDDGGTTTQSTTVLVAGVGLNNGILYIIGTAGKDQVELKAKGKDNEWIEVKAGFLSDKGHKRIFNGDEISSIVILVGGGNDQVKVDDKITQPVLIDGGAGNDHLMAGGGPTTLLGGNGNDVLIGGSSSDVLLGGNGNDVIFGNSGNDMLDGGNGNDHLFGGPGNDILIGGPGRDILIGGSGNDTLDGGTGYDWLIDWSGTYRGNRGPRNRGIYSAPVSPFSSWVGGFVNGFAGNNDTYDLNNSIQVILPPANDNKSKGRS